MVFLDEALAVHQDFLLGLDYRIRGQATVLFAQGHAASAGMKADAQFHRRLNFGIDELGLPPGENIVMIGSSGTSSFQKLSQAHLGGGIDGISSKASPNRIEKFQPGE